MRLRPSTRTTSSSPTFLSEMSPLPANGTASRTSPPPAAGAVPDLQTLVALLDALRRAVPPELSRQLAEAVRDLLLAVRAVIDWYLEKLGDRRPGSASPEVEDIPLD